MIPPFAFLRSAGGGGTPAPTLSALSYALGDVLGGGQSIVLTGTGFTGATDVKFGTTSATSFTVDSDTQITATLPAHAAGAVSVTVIGPGGTSGALSFEFWAPTTDASVTLLFDSLSSPYNAGTGVWTPRFSSASGAAFSNTTGTHHAASSGRPVFDGDLANEGGLIQASGAVLSSFFGTPVGSECAGSWGGVYLSTNVDALDLSTNPFLNPQVLGNENVSSGTLGLGFGDDAGTPSVYAHAYSGGYHGLAVPATAGALHAVVARLGTGAGSMDLSVDGATSGAGYDSTATAAGHDTAYTGYALSMGLEYTDNVVSSQTFAGEAAAIFVANAKVSDAFLAKFYAWSRQRFGVA